MSTMSTIFCVGNYIVLLNLPLESSLSLYSVAQWKRINGFMLLYRDHFQVHPESTPFLSKDGNAFANHQVHTAQISTPQHGRYEL
jgi:hypothetical protein